MTEPEKEIESDDISDLTFTLESYFDETDYQVDKFRNEFGIDKPDPGYYTGYDQVAEDFTRMVIESGDFKELLEFLDKNTGSVTPIKLLEKYFPETPEGTYAVEIPEIEESDVSEKPEIGSDPTILDSAYMKILNAINTSGLGIEEAISTFSNLDEDGFRDVILNGLKTAFSSFTTVSEGFNRIGKTDILMKKNNENLFVAECKIWKGPAEVIPAIDQLMGYLTLHDQKTALIFFVQKKDFSAVLNQFPEVIKKHSKFKTYQGIKNGNRFDFEFVQNDSKKSFRMAVFCFNFEYTPKKSKK